MGGYGLGGAMMSASRYANSPGVFAGIVEIAVVGYALIKAMAAIRRRLLAWHPETAGTDAALDGAASGRLAPERALRPQLCRRAFRTAILPTKSKLLRGRSCVEKFYW